MTTCRISDPCLSADLGATSSCRSQSMEACGTKGLTHMFLLRHCTVDDENAQAMKDQDGDSWATW